MLLSWGRDRIGELGDLRKMQERDLESHVKLDEILGHAVSYLLPFSHFYLCWVTSVGRRPGRAAAGRAALWSSRSNRRYCLLRPGIDLFVHWERCLLGGDLIWLLQPLCKVQSWSLVHFLDKNTEVRWFKRLVRVHRARVAQQDYLSWQFLQEPQFL